MDRQELSVYSQLDTRCKFNSRKKRTEIDQLVQILQHLRSSGDTIITSIARFTNMSHDSATRNCEKLVGAGLVAKELSYNNRKYKLTSEGRSFLDDYKKFADLLGRYRLNDLSYF